MVPMVSPHGLTFKPTKEQVAAGELMARECHTWMESHENEFRSMLRYTKALQTRDAMRRLRDRVMAWGLTNGIIREPFANALWAGIVRYMVIADPSLLESVRLCASSIDAYGLYPVSWMEGQC